MNDLKKQVTDFIEGSRTRIKGLTGKGKKVAEKWRATVDATGSKGLAIAMELASDLSPKDLMDRFGSKKFPELIEQIKASELARHSELIRQELLAFLRLPPAESVERIAVSVEKLTREVAGLRGLKADLKKLQDEVKALKTAAKGKARAEEPKAEAL